jgi:hypothetical protein
VITALQKHAARGRQDQLAVPEALLDPGQARTHTDGIELPSVAEVKPSTHDRKTHVRKFANRPAIPNALGMLVDGVAREWLERDATDPGML